MGQVKQQLQTDLEDLAESYPDWSISFEYGYFQAVHSNYDCSWEGEEDGYVSNGLSIQARTLASLREEISALVEERKL